MNNLIKNLIKKSRGVSLTKLEKAEIRQRLLAVIKSGEAANFVPTVRFSWGRILRPAFVSILIASLAGGGVSFAAEQALPGDVLYPVKINVNEEVHAALLPTLEAKADWEATRAIRRLEEAEALAAKGDLNDRQQQEIESNFEKHAQNSEVKIAALEDGTSTIAAEISSRLESSLNAHIRILEKLSARQTKGIAVAAKVKNRAEEVSLVRANAEDRLDSNQPEAMAFSAAAVNSFASEAPAAPSLKFRQAGALNEARSKFSDFKEAQKKKRADNEAKIFTKARNELKIDVEGGDGRQNPED